MKKKFYKRNCKSPIISQVLLDDFFEINQDMVKLSEFHELWDNWDMVMGELAPIAKPLGVRNKTLCIGVENNFELQELHLEYDELISRANSFMKAFNHDEFFEKLEIRLFQGKSAIKIKKYRRSFLNYLNPERPKQIGAKIDFKDETLLAKCYEAFCQRLDKEKS